MMVVKRRTLGVLAGCLALASALIVAGAAPAAAEFFGCKEPHSKVSYSRGYAPQRHAASDDNRAYWAAQRSRHANYSEQRSDRRARPDGWR